MNKIYLYAEFLGNIGQVTLHASLETHTNEQTRVSVEPVLKTVIVRHDGETAQLVLPVKVSATADLKVPSQRTKELSFRLQIEGPSTATSRPADVDDGTYWSSRVLRPTTKIKCRDCRVDVLQAQRDMTWKDLPSENWAELMDYWHCHKPHNEAEDDATTELAVQKGYGAGSKIVAESTIGLVDVSSFLLAAVDCPGALCKSEKLHNGYCEVCCRKCGALLGFREDQTQGWRLYKWSLALTASKEAELRTYPLESILCTQLLALIDTQAVRKFVVHSGGKVDGDTGILLWVFNPDLMYSSSNMPDGPRRAMKVFYKLVAQPQALLETNNTSLEELYLPSRALQKFRKALAKMTMLLPPSARKFNDWDVSLLDRPQTSS